MVIGVVVAAQCRTSSAAFAGAVALGLPCCSLLCLDAEQQRWKPEMMLRMETDCHCQIQTRVAVEGLAVVLLDCSR